MPRVETFGMNQQIIPCHAEFVRQSSARTNIANNIMRSSYIFILLTHRGPNDIFCDMRQRILLKRFGRLVVISYAGNKKYLCQCDCGNYSFPTKYNLVKGFTKSCGCLNTERRKEASVTHGCSNHPLYGTWGHMMHRCYNPANDRWSSYGGRGITVCLRWHDVRNFIEDNMNKKKPGLTLDRVDNNGPYSPENCTWSTAKQQSCNKRSNHYLTFKEQTLRVHQWSQLLNIQQNTILTRLSRGWSIEKTLTTPVNPNYQARHPR